MNKAGTSPTRILIVAAATVSLAVGVTGVAAASSDTTEPADDTTEPTHDMDTPAAYVEAGEPTSPEAAAFCDAVLTVDQAFNSEDEAAIGPALDALAEATPEDIAPTVEEILGLLEEDLFFTPEFAEAESVINDYIRANCGYAQIEVAASEYAFSGLPEELPAATTMIGLTNIGDEVHEIAIMRINDDVDLSIEELLALPEEEAETMATPVGFAFTFPGDTSYAVAELTPGRYVALCFLPEGATPDVIMELEELGVTGPDDSLPEGFELGPPHFVLGMVHEFDVVDA